MRGHGHGAVEGRLVRYSAANDPDVRVHPPDAAVRRGHAKDAPRGLARSEQVLFVAGGESDLDRGGNAAVLCVEERVFRADGNVGKAAGRRSPARLHNRRPAVVVDTIPLEGEPDERHSRSDFESIADPNATEECQATGANPQGQRLGIERRRLVAELIGHGDERAVAKRLPVETIEASGCGRHAH